MNTSKQKSKELVSELHEVYLCLGSNVGDRLAYLSSAVGLLAALPGTCVEKTSSIYETEPVGFRDQPDFLNLVVRLRTPLKPMELFRESKRIELAIGRSNTLRWQPREIDIDILLYDHLIFRSQQLFIPHTEMTKRRFVLTPLSEIAGSVIHPIEKLEIQALLQRCQDKSRVTKTEYQLILH